MALTNMDNAMIEWDAAGFAKELDFLQNYYSCCGSVTYSDWENVPTFTDYATVSGNLGLQLKENSVLQCNR